MRITKKAVACARKACALWLALLLLLAAAPPAAQATGVDESRLREEANRLTYEIVDLRARKKVAEREGDALQGELREIDMRIAALEEEEEAVREELAERQRVYDASLRTLYIQGETGELEVILEARELGEFWRDRDYFTRINGAHREALKRLKEKHEELGLRSRELRELRGRRERLAASLDVEGLEMRISELQARLDEINARLRELASGSTARRKEASPEPPPSWAVPPPGKLLERVATMPSLSDFERTGIVFSGYTTCYGEEFHGTPTASGVIFNMYDYTCAHRTLPFGTWLLVTYRGRQVIVQVNDRGPFVPGRVLDLSWGAAQYIGLDGVQWTECEIIVPRGG